MTQTAIEGAKPCPFCGGENLAYEEGSTFRWEHIVCHDCEARCGEMRNGHRGALLETWNERATQTDQQTAWFCVSPEGDRIHASCAAMECQSKQRCAMAIGFSWAELRLYGGSRIAPHRARGG